MKLTLLTPALAAVLGLALASAPLPTQAQTDTTMSSAAPTSAPATTTTTSSTSTKPKKPTTPHTNGTLAAVDTTANTVSVENKKDGTRTFSIASTAVILKDKKPATLADLVVGDKIYVAYTKDASGTMTATKVSTTTPKTKPAAAATPATAAPATTTTSNP